MQDLNDRIRKAKMLYYPLLEIRIDDIKYLYRLFNKYFKNVGATIVYKDHSYKVGSESDLDLPGDDLYYFEIVGYDPFSSLILCKEKSRLLISDINDKASQELKDQVDALLVQRYSRWNLLVGNTLLSILLLLLFSSIGLLILYPHSLLYISIFFTFVLLIIIQYFLRDFLNISKHTQLVSNPDIRKDLDTAAVNEFNIQDWRKSINNMLRYSLLNMSRSIIFFIIGCTMFWLAIHLLNII